MTIENSSLSLSGVRASISTCALSVAVLVWGWLEATLGTVDFSKSSGPPTDGVTVNGREIRTSAEDSTSHLSFRFCFCPHWPAPRNFRHIGLLTHRFATSHVGHASRSSIEELNVFFLLSWQSTIRNWFCYVHSVVWHTHTYTHTHTWSMPVSFIGTDTLFQGRWLGGCLYFIFISWGGGGQPTTCTNPQ